MAYSIQTAVSDGTLEVLDLSIKYMDKSHIFVYVDDVLVDGSAYSYVWLTDTRIQVVPAVANGSTLKVIRKTLTDEMWHEFSKGARFSTTSMDENFEQLLFLAQEYSEGVYVSDFYSDVDLHLRRILNLGDPINDGDAVNLKTLKEYLPNADLLPSIVERVVAEEVKSAQMLSQGLTVGNKVIVDFDGTNVPNNAWVHLAGYSAVGDGGGGHLRFLKDSVIAADGVTVYKVAGGRLSRDGWSVFGINPRWCGAIGDNTSHPLSERYSTLTAAQAVYPHAVALSDELDWAAFQNAFNVAANKSAGGQISGYTNTQGTPTIRITGGSYILNRPVSMGAYTDVQVDSRAIIQQKTGYSGVLFYATTPYQITWSGGIFQARANGSGGVWWLGNANYPTRPINIDQGRIHFRNFEAKGFQDVFPVVANRSAQVKIEDYKIDRCIHFIGRGTNLNTTTGSYSQLDPLSGFGGYADMIEIGAGWATMSDLMSTDFDGFICGDNIHIRGDILFVPVVHGGRECAWVNAWTSHSSDGVRYGGEPGSMAPANWMGSFSNTYPINQTSVSIRNSPHLYNTEVITTTLSAAIDASTTSIPLTDASKFPSAGQITIDGELITYTSKSGNTLTANTRNSKAVTHLLGATVNLNVSTVVRLFNGLPNLLEITGNAGGQDMATLVNYYTGFTSFSTLQANAHSPDFKCKIKDNCLTSIAGDFWPAIYDTTEIDYDRVGSFPSYSTTAGSSGSIRTILGTVRCSRAKSFEVRARIKADATNPYWQSIAGTLFINYYSDGSGNRVYGSFDKRASLTPPVPGTPSSIDVVNVLFAYPDGSVSTTNNVPFEDRFIVKPVLELKASVGGVDATGFAKWEVIG